MKKCPFCKAEIEDNARFCLYCMKPLNEKEVIPPPQRKPQWWLFVLAAVLLIALLAVILLTPRGNADLPSESTGEESTSISQTTDTQASETTDKSMQDTQSDSESQGDTILEENQNATGTPDTNQKPNQSQNSNTQTSTEGTTPATKPTTPTTPTTTPTTTTITPQETTQPEETIAETTEPDNTTMPEETTAPETQKTEVVYTYRAARAGDDFNANYTNSGNDIVITGIAQQSAGGIYDIPSYIDGQKVIAIVANTFSGSNAKIVYVPATVKTIWNYAFAGCGLTDIYFRGGAIYTESKAFSGNFTLHCSASCSDRNYRYYKNTAASYGATWAEWNG